MCVGACSRALPRRLSKSTSDGRLWQPSVSCARPDVQVSSPEETRKQTGQQREEEHLQPCSPSTSAPQENALELPDLGSKGPPLISTAQEKYRRFVGKIRAKHLLPPRTSPFAKPQVLAPITYKARDYKFGCVITLFRTYSRGRFRV